MPLRSMLIRLAVVRAPPVSPAICSCICSSAEAWLPLLSKHSELFPGFSLLSISVEGFSGS